MKVEARFLVADAERDPVIGHGTDQRCAGSVV
jgi:hypothetical protein